MRTMGTPYQFGFPLRPLRLCGDVFCGECFLSGECFDERNTMGLLSGKRPVGLGANRKRIETIRAGLVQAGA